MKIIRVFLSENFHFLEVKFSIYLNRRVLVMNKKKDSCPFLAKACAQVLTEYAFLTKDCLQGY